MGKQPFKSIHAICTQYVKDGKIYLATLLCRDNSSLEVESAYCYEPSQMNKQEFERRLFRDISSSGCSTYEIIQCEVKDCKMFQVAGLN